MGCDSWCFFCCGESKNTKWFCWLFGGYKNKVDTYEQHSHLYCIIPCCLHYHKETKERNDNTKSIYDTKLIYKHICTPCGCITENPNEVEYESCFGKYTHNKTGNSK